MPKTYRTYYDACKRRLRSYRPIRPCTTVHMVGMDGVGATTAATEAAAAIGETISLIAVSLLEVRPRTEVTGLRVAGIRMGFALRESHIGIPAREALAFPSRPMAGSPRRGGVDALLLLPADRRAIIRVAQERTFQIMSALNATGGDSFAFTPAYKPVC